MLPGRYAAPSEHSAELIGSQALKNLIQVLRLHYDLVILDGTVIAADVVVKEPDSVPIETVRGFGYRYKTP